VRIELVPRTHCRDMSPPYQLSDRGSLSGAGLCVARTYSIQFNSISHIVCTVPGFLV
jgi:hypothetical protein